MEDGRKQVTTKFYFFFCTWTWSLGIQLHEMSNFTFYGERKEAEPTMKFSFSF